ncbi:MAG: methyltransferase domain-containing protein [archaeon]
MSWKGFKDVQATIQVDINPPIEEILKKVDRSRRKNIKKASESGLRFIESKSEKDEADWYEIYKKVWTEGGIDYKSPEFFRKPNWKLFLVKLGKKTVGGGVFEELEDRIIFRAYASLIEYQQYRINDFLYWNSFLYAKNKGKKRIDLGGWQINARGHLAGINSFKEKWGGEIVYYYIYSKNPIYILGRKAIKNSIFARWIWDRIKGRPEVIKDKDKLNKQSYDNKSSIEHFENLNKKGLFDIESKIVKKYFHGKILDLGCGYGRTTKALYNGGYDVIGVDIVEDMINGAKKKYPEIKFEVGDACDLNFPENTFDVVFFSYNGLDYIFPEIERKKAIKEIERVLNKGGIFVYSSHNSHALFLKFRPKFIWRNIKKRTLFSRYKCEQQPFGELYTYYASPKEQKMLVEKNSKLKFVEKVSRGINDLHPHYVFRKQEN